MKSNAILWYQCIVRFCFPFQRCLFCFHEIFADFYLFFKMVCEVECNSWIRSITTLFGFFDEFVGIIERNLTKVIKPRTFLKIWTFALLFVVHWLLKTNMFITNFFFFGARTFFQYLLLSKFFPPKDDEIKKGLPTIMQKSDKIIRCTKMHFLFRFTRDISSLIYAKISTLSQKMCQIQIGM